MSLNGLPHIHFADDTLLVLEKPAGLLSVPGLREADCLSARARTLYPDALVVHRLDQATSGLLLMARGVQAQRRLSRAFAVREIRKQYIGVVHGEPNPPGDAGWRIIDLPLLPDWPNRPRQKVDPAAGKPSVTRWRVLAREDGMTRVELEPITGRTHQLRVHLQAIGHPLAGDELYGPSPAAAPRLLLHASRLTFIHPVSGAALRFDSPPPF